MSEFTLNLMSRCLRDSLYFHINLIFMLYLFYRACGAKKTFRPQAVAAFMELRMVMDLLAIEVADVFWGQTEWYPFFMALISLIHILWGIYVLLRYFNGPPEKIIFGCFWTETFSTGCLMGAWALAYWGTGETYTLSGQVLRSRDILMAAYYIPLCILCATALGPVLRAYRNYQVRHPRLLLYLDLLVVFNQFYTNIYTSLPHGAYRSTLIFLLGSVTTMLLAAYLMKRANRQKRIYAQQQRFVETHLGLLREQAAWVMDSRSQLEEQISVVESLPPGEQDTLAQSYLAELKAQYHAFLSGIRCKDPLVDALLSHQEIMCRQQGIRTEFSMEQYDRGELKEQEVVVLLMVLLDGAVRSCLKSGAPGRISLTMAQLKGQLLLELSHSGKQKLSREGFRPVLRQHDGVFWQKREGDGWRVEILLETR